ncbi:hypothetical protein SMD11_0188 [Streptomyces albireticuli]|uniref:Uncharacterized protein n=1 Tax=Streptomyces albireticuli TaxID=1940 RepID=A0A1Z2KUX5_9ACTN|nr:hypothetical protein SMD11_0188 [Streptomyces albireticuli]
MSARNPDLGRIGIWAGDFDRLPATGIRKAAGMTDGAAVGH